jgi:hypothetical protein
MPKPALLLLCSSSVGSDFWRMREALAVPTASLVPWTGAPRSPQRTWAENDGDPEGKPIKRSLSTKPLKGSPEKPRPQKNPEGYGLQPVRNASI